LNVRDEQPPEPRSQAGAEADAEADADADPGSKRTHRRKGRRWPKFVAAAIVIFGVLAAIVFIAPTLVARYVAADQLEAMGIETEGVETLEIDIWNREVVLGPVRFKALKSADFGSLDRIRVEIGVSQLLEKGILIERLIVSGVNLHVVQQQDGNLIVNGVDISALGGEGEPAPDPDPQAEEEAPWKAGVGALEFTDSTITFVNAKDGRLEIVIERVVLADFFSWSPDLPGSFEAVGSVNDIAFSWSGTAQPFAETVQASVDGQLRGIELDKITQFTGPLGFERSQGSVDTEIHSEFSLAPDGSVDGQGTGTIEIADAHLALPGAFDVRFDEASFALDAKAAAAADGGLSAQGELDLGIANGSLGTGDGRALAFTRLALDVPDLDFGTDAEGALRLAAQPSLRLDAPEASGPVGLAAASLSLDARDLALARSGERLTVAGGLTLDVAQPAMTAPSRLGADDVRLALRGIEAEVTAAQTSLSAGADLKVAQLNVAEPVALTADAVALALDTLAVRQAGDELSVAASGTHAYETLAVRLGTGDGAPGPAFQAQAIQATLAELAYRVAGAQAKVTGGLKIDIAQPQGAVPVGQAQGEVGADALSFQASDLDVVLAAAGVTGGGGLAARVDALEADWPAAPGMPALSASIGAFELADATLDLRQEQGAMAVDARFGLAADSFAASLADSEVGKAVIGKIAVRGGTVGGALDAGLAIRADAIELTKPEIDLTDQALGAFGGEPGTKEDDAQETEPLEPGGTTFGVGRFFVTDTGSVTFVDTSVQPRVRLNAVIEILEAEDVNAAEPQQRSPVKLATAINEFTKVQLVGWVKPFTDPVGFSFAGRLGGLSLPALSPYAAQAVGMNLEQGSLSVKADAETKEGKLQGRIELDVEDLAFSPLSEADAARLSAKIGLPLDTIVGLLKDSGGQIELNIPISGDLKDPSFDLSDAIGQALGGALTAAITAPFKLLFEPVNFVAGQVVGEKLAFKPVAFEPGAPALDAEGRAFLDALNEMLDKRPNLRIQICGRATAQDLQAYQANRQAGAAPAQQPDARAQAQAPSQPPPGAAPVSPGREAEADAARPELQALAEERTRAVRRYLVEEGGVDAGRIGECRSTFDATDQGPPRVEIKLGG
jgi:hypothetical protein